MCVQEGALCLHFPQGVNIKSTSEYLIRQLDVSVIGNGIFV